MREFGVSAKGEAARRSHPKFICSINGSFFEGNIIGSMEDEVVEFFDCTVGELLEENARKHPDRDALIYSDRDLKYSYRELNARVDRVAKGMLALGIGKGDHVGIWATNVPDWLTIFYATARIGAVLVTVNTSYRPSELEYVMQQSDMKALFLIDGYRDTDYVQAVYDLVPELKTMPKGSLQSTRFPF